MLAGLSLNEMAVEEDSPEPDKGKRPSKWAVSTPQCLSYVFITFGYARILPCMPNLWNFMRRVKYFLKTSAQHG